MESVPATQSQRTAVPLEPSSVARDERAVDRALESSIDSARPVDDAGENCCCSLLRAVACCFLGVIYDLLSWIRFYPNHAAQQRAVVQFLNRFPHKVCDEEDLREAFFQGFLQLPAAAQRAARQLVYQRYGNDILSANQESDRIESKMRPAAARTLSAREVVELVNEYISNDYFNYTAREALANFAGIQPQDED